MAIRTLPDALPTTVEIGIHPRRALVVMNIYGNQLAEPTFVAWTATEAREVAKKLEALARTLEGQEAS